MESASLRYALGIVPPETRLDDGPVEWKWPRRTGRPAGTEEAGIWGAMAAHIFKVGQLAFGLLGHNLPTQDNQSGHEGRR